MNRVSFSLNAIYICIFTFIIFSGISTADPTAGLYKIEIKQGWNLICIPMQTLQLSEGKITSLTSNTITDSAKSWTVNTYQNAVVLISNGTGEGYWYKISSNTSTALTLSSSLSSSIAVGNYFYIYKAFTLSELFGTYSSGPLHADTSKSNADEVYLWDKSAQAFSTSIWLCNTSGQEGWWQGSTRITDNSVTLLPNEACFVVRKPSSTATINYVGVVPNTKQTLNVKSGDNILGESFPASVTMNNSGLSSILTSATSSYTADNVYLWDYDSQKFNLPIWHSNYPGYENWYRGSDNANSVNLEPAKGLMVKNRSTEKNWQRSKPYTAP